jgi:hypothetical protein
MNRKLLLLVALISAVCSMSLHVSSQTPARQKHVERREQEEREEQEARADFFDRAEDEET